MYISYNIVKIYTYKLGQFKKKYNRKTTFPDMQD